MDEGVTLMFFLIILTLAMFYSSLYIRNKFLLLFSSILLSLTGYLLIATLFPYYELLVVCLFRDEVVAIPPCTLLIGQVAYIVCIVAITFWQMKEMGKND